MIRKVLELDNQLTNRMRLDTGPSFWWKVVGFLAHSGDSWFWMIGLVIIWLFIDIWRANAAFLILAILAQVVLVMGIKFTVRRSRPPGDWGTIYRNTDPHSFPSGHAARAFMLALIAVSMGPLLLAVAMVLWAFGVSFSRIFTGMHYLSDVLAGMIIGLGAGVILLNLRPVFEELLPFLF
jgi:membrane-associated phospholipid phosphatase